MSPVRSRVSAQFLPEAVLIATAADRWALSAPEVISSGVVLPHEQIASGLLSAPRSAAVAINKASGKNCAETRDRTGDLQVLPLTLS